MFRLGFGQLLEFLAIKLDLLSHNRHLSFSLVDQFCPWASHSDIQYTWVYTYIRPCILKAAQSIFETNVFLYLIITLTSG